ncbi:host cell division inhibitor Icd-like protein [Pasteurellaceae bacterium HPA106]|uniref:host cell division inhibitor Icd-like protein n=1 Tax=Spirabiliibacterium pneumoniae TaxID=221400 RepID=UPI001AADE815|nr:host cell division inhibitor Icd-like protein [Spirabiliibacterium pneumoniae]MBE2896579.1 host cell division inhibitor Icd-like protein [Spirabiliibacterium pneumoniae]
MTDTHSSKKHFTSAPLLSYFIRAVAKSTAEPANSNKISVAHCTPYACFFMRSARTFHERQARPERRERLSMVACSGKGSALCCVPLIAVLQPVTRYRPRLQTLAVTSHKIFSGVIAMIYQFLGVSRQHYDRTRAQQLRIQANSEQHARASFARDYVLILLGQLPDSAKTDRTLVAGGAK